MAFVRWGWVVATIGLAVAPAFASAPASQMAGEGVYAGEMGNVAFNGDSAQGEHAIRLFDAQGRLVRDVDLGDFLSKDYVAALPGDSNGLQWRRGTKLAKDAVEFDVAVPGAADAALHFSIDLRDGLVRTAQIREYLAATDQARARAAIAAR
jgi:hypothetical protein